MHQEQQQGQKKKKIKIKRKVKLKERKNKNVYTYCMRTKLKADAKRLKQLVVFFVFFSIMNAIKITMDVQHIESERKKERE